MRDLVLLAYLLGLIALAFKRPFLLVLVYCYIDIVSPQRLSYFLLNRIPVSAIAFALAFSAWVLIDNKKKDSRFSFRQFLMLLLLGVCGYTTAHADFPIDAGLKWDWVWKSLVFGIFLPLTLCTRLRIEALALTLVLCASSIIVTGGIKTVLSGGGYGTLNLMVSEDSGLYEGSIISTVSIALIPLILWLARHGTIFKSGKLVRLYALALCFSCLLMPIGTQARTGLLCAALLAGLMVWRAKRRFLHAGLLALSVMAAIPFLPSSFTERMDTIKNYQGDESASTRIAVWKWTLDYVKEHPGGGGFDAYRSNSFTYDAVKVQDGRIVREKVTDKARAYHNSYFEVLGEQGYLGFAIWAAVHLVSLIQTHRIFRLYRKRTGPDEAWISPLALALQQGHLVYLMGSIFVGIAYQPFVFMLLALQIGLSTYIFRLRKQAGGTPIFAEQGDLTPCFSSRVN